MVKCNAAFTHSLLHPLTFSIKGWEYINIFIMFMVTGKLFFFYFLDAYSKCTAFALKRKTRKQGSALLVTYMPSYMLGDVLQ